METRIQIFLLSTNEGIAQWAEMHYEGIRLWIPFKKWLWVLVVLLDANDFASNCQWIPVGSTDGMGAEKKKQM